jgi:hypothetical protein
VPWPSFLCWGFLADLFCTWKPERLGKIEPELVGVTPSPVLIRLEGLNDRVIGGVEMSGGMLILRIVTAADMTTDEADTQVDPGITRFQTIFAAIGARCDLTYLVEVATGLWHLFLLTFFLQHHVRSMDWTAAICEGR